ncbi:MerR family transcriptional regulator [Litchfieldia salsa]|uniref:VASP tetramerisation domain-containing protein n=1 Tax=Litchfieldia salsa TaxID=930152 RepID=A0A1H0Q2H9_9BACI|nr:MerR family transcriptional regulator [Litchfieldia salsa]SDP11225.1 VASP tetramerisation domain-containing protein [Litchfieldia salsa]
MTTTQFLKAYSINEVSEMINTPTGTIRQWEKDLNGLLIIPRTKQGARFYTETEIALLQKIKEMRDQKVHKNLIRSLLAKHLESASEPSSEAFEPSHASTNEHEVQVVSNEPPVQQENQIEEMNLRMEAFKQQLLQEIKTEMAHNKNEIVDEIKNELVNNSLHTVQGISKSIQRSNDKRKVEVQVLSDSIQEASERTSERLETLSSQVANDSQGTYEQLEILSSNIAKDSERTSEQLSRKIDQSIKATTSNNLRTLSKVNNSIGDMRHELNEFSKSLGNEQKQISQINQTIHELKEYTETLHHREEVFQELVTNFRQVAASKEKNRWWKFW